jgi:hypothetical protein
MFVIANLEKSRKECAVVFMIYFRTKLHIPSPYVFWATDILFHVPQK